MYVLLLKGREINNLVEFQNNAIKVTNLMILKEAAINTS